ncbi:two-component system, sensor histidine kinase YesM [Paenibacillus sophorae]|uniref:Sensor histidine kinase n=1 Tax=Paenibacillus sophorae TaxID=1333845 RepID=A0A1H8G9B1_9BACL|nr:sensor histidine kinase [Paenibacillus sophorae]QWU14139.1 sensor histidine kinase [Paenibacillus sophorae]SEN40350.1 two-component system, sensor histidine kinase YesM [Paenibacillus sophorae]
MRRVKAFLFHMSLRTRLTLSFIAMTVLSLAVMAVGYNVKSSDVILKNASETSLGLVRMGNQSLDSSLARVEQSAINMHLDQDLFQFFNTDNLRSRDFTIDSDRKITRILQKYFPTSEDMFSVNLVTRDYTFGETPSFWIPKKDYFLSKIYKIGTESLSSITWIPTYNLLEQFYSTAPSEKDQYVFTATRLMNFAIVRNNILIQMKKSIERPILVVNFQEFMFQRALEESLNVEGSYYHMYTREGAVLSSSELAGDPAEVSREWIARAISKKSGTEYITLGGQKLVVCFDTIKTTGWLTAVFIPYKNLKRTLPDMFEYTLYSVLIITLISVVVAAILSGRITMPLIKLLRGINRSGDGHFNTWIESAGTRELNIIIHKFNQMNESIYTLIEENYKAKMKELEAELKALNFQFNPHFLYNTLNIINYLAIENKQSLISKMLVELSEMLEYTAKSPGKVVFFEDLNYLKNYVFIMSRRFEDKFAVTYEIEPELERHSVPKFFLQPFIENALVHALEDKEQGGLIHVTGKIDQTGRIFTVTDNGKGMSLETIARVLKIHEDTDAAAVSIGIQNVNQRIKLLYGPGYGVDIRSKLNEGTTVILRLPLDIAESGRGHTE